MTTLKPTAKTAKLNKFTATIFVFFFLIPEKLYDFFFKLVKVIEIRKRKKLLKIGESDQSLTIQL